MPQIRKDKQEERMNAIIEMADERLEDNKEIDNKLELMKFTTEVQSKIKEDINSDYILCRLENRDKEAVIEMVSNAYFIKRILSAQGRKGKKHEWNHKEHFWITRPYTKQEKDQLNEMARTIFLAYIIRVQMTVLINRNVPNNYLIKIVAGYHDETEDQPEQKEEKKTLLQKTADLFKPNEKRKEDGEN